MLRTNKTKMIITIDGPAGAGKSTVAKSVAAALGFAFLDTGATYRAGALLGIRAKLDWSQDQTPQLLQLLKTATITVRNGRTWLNEEDITDVIRDETVTQHVKYLADNPAIRDVFVRLQRELAASLLETYSGIVTEGRDQGTVVFPEAACKFYLTASESERARRRVEEIRQRGGVADFDTILEQIQIRDTRDSTRAAGPLKQPAEAIVIYSDSMTADEVVQYIVHSL